MKNAPSITPPVSRWNSGPGVRPGETWFTIQTKTVTVFVWIVNQVSPGITPGPLFHLLTGGVMLGAFFMATDYVTSPVTHLGGVVFGIGIGIIVCVIRIWGSFPEGMSFAIVIMNALVPLIDRFCYKRPFGWNPVNAYQPRRGEIK